MSKELKLRDKIIHNLVSDFIVNGVQVEQVRYHFPECKGMACQGLILIHKRKTKVKKIVLDYWLNNGVKKILKNGKTVYGESRRYHLGIYNKDTFNVKKIELKVASLRKDYGNPNNQTWDLDIEEGEKLKKRTRYNEQLGQIQSPTINIVIERYLGDNCPKINRPSETLNKTTSRKNIVYIAGYHERTKALSFTADAQHNGLIEFKETCLVNGVVRPGVKSWGEFWAKFPAKGSDKIGKGISIYDSSLGQKNIRKLTEYDCRNYLQTVTDSLGTRRSIKECISALWKYALNKTLLGENPPKDPVENIKIEHPKTSKYSHYNKAEYSQEEINKIYYKCKEKENKYLFQTPVVLLQLFTGRRKETFLKMIDDYIQWYKTPETVNYEDGTVGYIYGKVTIPTYVNKTDNPDKFLITENVKDVLRSHEKQKAIHSWTKFIKWTFPSPRVKQKGFLRKGSENNSEEARLKDVRGLWDEIRRETGIDISSQKMFRNTYENRVNQIDEAKSTWDVITVTGRADTKSSEVNYLNKNFTPKTRRIAAKVDDQFRNIIKIRK